MKHGRGLVVVAVATVVATSGPIPEVAARLEAAGSGAATADRNAAEASTVAAGVCDQLVVTAATAGGGLLIGRGSQHWNGAGRPWRLSRLRGRRAGRIGPGTLVTGAGGLLLGQCLAADEVGEAEGHPGVRCARAMDGAPVGVGSQNAVERR